jgi:hypothetical protein
MHDKRVVELPDCGEKVNIALFDMPSVRIVPEAQEELGTLVEAPEFGVPLPVIVIPIFVGTVMPLVHVQDPDGIWITSPSAAVCVGPLMIALTALCEHEAAV